MSCILDDTLGNIEVLTSADLLASYTTGWRGEKGRAEFVARPRTTEDVSRLVSWCVQKGIQLVPQSGRTGLVGASVPDSVGGQAVLSLEQLRDTCALDRVNRSLTCSAGYRLSEINAHLAGANLFFPIDLGADPCIGGMIATNTGGGRLLRYGGVRDNVMGLKVVLGDELGSVVELGSAWRKYAIGPDWKHMFVGTGAAFGIITECTLNTEPKPRDQACALLALKDEKALPDVLVELESTFGSLLSACEFMSASALRAAWSHSKQLRKPFAHNDVPELVLLVEISCDWNLGNMPVHEMLIDGLSKIFSENEDRIGEIVLGRTEELWAIRHAISEGVRLQGRLYGFDLSFRRSDVLDFRRQMKAVLADLFPDIEVCDFGHVGDGGIHFNLVDRVAETHWSPDRETAVRELVIRTAVEEFRGCFSAEHGVGPVNFKYFDRYTPAIQRRFSDALEHVTSGRRIGRVHFGHL